MCIYDQQRPTQRKGFHPPAIHLRPINHISGMALLSADFASLLMACSFDKQSPKASMKTLPLLPSVRTLLCRLYVTLLALALSFVTSGTCMASMSTTEFLNEFTKNYYEQQFLPQTNLVKDNRDLVPLAVASLIEEAHKKDKSFGEKMYLLNIASAMAYMQRHLHGDSKPLMEVEPIIKTEIEKEKKRNAELMKWKKEEQFLGNFVMMRHEKKLQEEGLAPVLYPHWKHRILFECKVCHNSIFRMQRWVNNISQEKIVAGEQCGTCHNGTIAFGVENNCNRCHIAGEPGAEKLHNPDLINHAEVKKTAEKIGARWRPENLKDGRLPLDRFGLIDWLQMKRDNAFTPIASLDKNYNEKTRDNQILFISKSNFVNNVLFNHRVHSDWIDCSTCHPAIFSDKLGENDMKMRDMSKGRYCGHCHGKVSFKFADCKRCHNQPKEAKVNALVRHPDPGN